MIKLLYTRRTPTGSTYIHRWLSLHTLSPRWLINDTVKRWICLSLLGRLYHISGWLAYLFLWNTLASLQPSARAIKKDVSFSCNRLHWVPVSAGTCAIHLKSGDVIIKLLLLVSVHLWLCWCSLCPIYSSLWLPLMWGFIHTISKILTHILSICGLEGPRCQSILFIS